MNEEVVLISGNFLYGFDGFWCMHVDMILFVRIILLSELYVSEFTLWLAETSVASIGCHKVDIPET